jgi:hypothetical protein
MNYALNAFNYFDAASLLSQQQQQYTFAYTTQPNNPAQHVISSQHSNSNRPSSVSSSVSSKSTSPSSSSSPTTASQQLQFNPLLNHQSHYLSSPSAYNPARSLSAATVAANRPATNSVTGLQSLLNLNPAQSQFSNVINTGAAIEATISYQHNYTNNGKYFHYYVKNSGRKANFVWIRIA